MYPFKFQVIKELEMIKNDDDDLTVSSEQILAGFREGNLSFTCHLLI